MGLLWRFSFWGAHCIWSRRPCRHMHISFLALLLAVSASFAMAAPSSQDTIVAPQTSEEIKLGDEEVLETFWYRVDTSSPRATLATFYRSMRRYPH